MDSIPEGLTVDEGRVRISPLVPSIILDYHHMRDWKREDEKERENNEYSVGVILGKQIGNNAVITNAFGTKYTSGPTPIDQDYIKFMTKYLIKGTKEEIIGMFIVYNKGQDIDNVEYIKAFNLINTQISEKTKTILLTMDGTLEKPTLNMKTYTPLVHSLEITSSALAVFNNIPNEVITNNMTESGLDTVLHGQENFDTLSVYWRQATRSKELAYDEVDALKKTQKLYDTTEKIKLTISNISDMLEEAKEYVNNVVEGSIEGDPEIGRALNNCLSKISHISADSIEKLLKDHYQDLLTLCKLTNQIKTQLSNSLTQSTEIR